jgi:DNA-binding GntR family transcriptional regulator
MDIRRVIAASKTYSSNCAVAEHREIIAALACGDAESVMALMHHHLDSVAGRPAPPLAGYKNGREGFAIPPRRFCRRGERIESQRPR